MWTTKGWRWSQNGIYPRKLTLEIPWFPKDLIYKSCKARCAPILGKWYNDLTSRPKPGIMFFKGESSQNDPTFQVSELLLFAQIAGVHAGYIAGWVNGNLWMGRILVVRNASLFGPTIAIPQKDAEK